MKKSSDVDIEMNSLTGKLITTGTTQTSTTTMSGVRTRRISKLPLTTVDSSNLSNLMRLNRPKEELIFGPSKTPSYPYSTIQKKPQSGPAPPLPSPPGGGGFAPPPPPPPSGPPSGSGPPPNEGPAVPLLSPGMKGLPGPPMNEW